MSFWRNRDFKINAAFLSSLTKKRPFIYNFIKLFHIGCHWILGCIHAHPDLVRPQNSIQFNNGSPNTSLTNSLQPIPSSPNCRGSTPTSANISSISSPLNSSSKLSSAAWNSLIVRKCFFRWSFARYLKVSCVSKRIIDWVLFIERKKKDYVIDLTCTDF